MDHEFKMVELKKAKWTDSVLVAFQQQDPDHVRRIWVELSDADLEAIARMKLANVIVTSPEAENIRSDYDKEINRLLRRIEELKRGGEQ